jgi:hypothetical protein
MPVVPEAVVLDLLARCVAVSQEVLPLLAKRGADTPAPEVVDRFTAIVSDLHRQKRHDSRLSDESWEWIWDTPSGLSHLQLYGRLAWLNYALLDCL